MTKTTTDLSVILTVHREGARIQATARSLLYAFNKVKSKGIQPELIVVRDASDNLTVEYTDTTLAELFKGYDIHLYDVDFESMGAARNFGIQHSAGAIVAVIDADDLVSEDVFTRGVEYIQSRKEEAESTVYHPEYTFAFGIEYWGRKLPDSASQGFVKRPLINDPIWPSFVIARKEIFNEVLFMEAPPGHGDGPIHWQWNVDILTQGINHTPIPGTCLYQRQKGSHAIFDQYINKGGLLNPSQLLRRDGAYLEDTDGDEIAEVNIPSLTVWAKAKQVISTVAPKSPRMRESYRLIKSGLKHAISPTESLREQSTESIALPEWLNKDRMLQYDFEHHIYPDEGALTAIANLPPSETVLTREYWHITNALPEVYEFIFIIPGITKGGAELVMMNYLNAIYQEKPHAKVLLVAVEEREPTLLSELPKNVTFYQMRHQYFALPVHERIRLLATLVRQLSPRILHIINTEEGFGVVERFGRAVVKDAKIYASLFGPNRFSDNRRTHVLLDNTAMAQHIQRIFTDNKKTAKEFEIWTGLPADFFVAHYQPLSGADKQIATQKGSVAGDTLRVLWAGRMDKEKRADIYNKIAKTAVHKGINMQFDAYGTSVVDETRKDEILISESEFVQYKGPFHGGVRNIPGSYDIFILTSDFEGLPNALIEAASRGMVLIAPDVGGVSEVVTSSSGFLIHDNTDVAQYVEALELLAKDHKLLIRLREGAMRLVAERHTWNSFINQVKQEPGYLGD